MSSQQEEIERIVEDMHERYRNLRLFLGESGKEKTIARINKELWFDNYLRDTLTSLTEAHKVEMKRVLEEVADEIPEAYGWGVEDEEADRGYQICSRNVKAMIRKRANEINIEVK